MHLMYVDESGDTGLQNSPTEFFILSAIVVHELRWRNFIDNLVAFRRYLRDLKGLKLREEIHATDFINRPGELIRIRRNDRLDILKKCITWLNSQSDICTYSVIVDKRGKSNDIFELAWNALTMRFENTIRHKNFPGPQNPDERGIILSDNTEGEKLRKLIRRMRHYNPTPNRTDLYNGGFKNIPLDYVIEDPIFRDSENSYIHQMNDVIAYFVRQLYEPNAYMRKKGGKNFYYNLSNIALQVASSSNNYGLVEI